MHKKLGLLVMLVGILALSMAFTGCPTDAEFAGDPLPWYMVGTYAGTTVGQRAADLVLSKDEAQLGTTPYKLSTSFSENIDGDEVTGTMTFYVYNAPYDTVGTVDFTYSGVGIITEAIAFENPAFEKLTVEERYDLPNGSFGRKN